jgi:hypothetical protein
MPPTYGGTCARGLSSGIYAGLPGGVSGGRGEVGGFGRMSVGTIIAGIAIPPRTKIYKVSDTAVYEKCFVFVR